MPTSGLTLIIGDKNTSSWSLRSWVLLKAFDIPFREERVVLRRADTTSVILGYSPAGLVPVLEDGVVTVWDTLAIAEYVAEAFKEKALWPAPREARALARSITAEMHSGFAALRGECPMNILGHMTGYVPGAAVARNIVRIESLWADARARFGAGGDFLFGAFSVADAFYAPVVTRFRTYGVKLSAVSRAYCDAVLDHAAMREWEAAARAEMKERVQS